MADEEEIREIVGFRLIVTAAGPNYRDLIEIESDSLEGLKAEHVIVEHLTFERYRGASDDEYVEVRFDYVVGRRLEVIYEKPEPSSIVGDMSFDDRPTEMRLRNREDSA